MTERPKVQIPRPGKEPLEIPILSDEEMMERRPLMICSPTKHGPSSVPSKVYQCSRCGQDVWASIRASVPYIEQGLIVVCVECLAETQSVEPDVASDRLLDEVEDTFGGRVSD